jgi:hypothetical protein
MGPGEFLVFFSIVAAAVLALMLILTNAYKRGLDFKLRKLELEAQAKAPLAGDDRTDLLEDRVRVLERIATDRGQDIAHQIEALRDRQIEEKI